MKFLVFLILYLLSNAFVDLDSATTIQDSYWISFAGLPISNDDHAGGGPRYLMRIGADGTVLLPPVKVVGATGVGSGISTTTIRKLGTEDIVMWYSTQLPIFRAVISKRTLKTKWIVKTQLQTISPYQYQVSQVGEGVFAYQRFLNQTEDRYVAVRILPNGSFSRERWSIAPSTVCRDLGCTNGLSRDGRVAFYSSSPSTERRLAIQRLDTQSKPVGVPFYLGDRPMRGKDISGSNDQSQRFLIYSLQNSGGPLYLQSIDMSARKLLGNPVKVGFNLSLAQSAAIDPKRRFVIFCTLDGKMFYQSVNSLGEPFGNRKLIAQKVATGMDLLQE